VVGPRAGGDSPKLRFGATSSGASGGAFIGAREGMVAWARAVGEGPTRGQNRGCSCLAGASGGSRSASSARSRRKSLRGGFLRGKSKTLWARGRFPGAGRPTWLGGLSCAGLRLPAGLPAMGHGSGRREEGEDGDLSVNNKNSRGLDEKGAQTHSSRVKSKTFEY
jgi:hypothetical protein